MSRPYANPLLLRCERGQRPLWSLVDAFCAGALVIPDYQRGRVWTPAQQSAFVGYALSRAPVPAFFIRQVNAPDGFRDELIDGQQRLTAMVAWLDGEVPATHWQTGEPIWCVSSADSAALRSLPVPVLELPPDATRRDAIGVYLALNGGGTPHTAAELERVRDLLRGEP
jgi:hypothetical protein